MIREKITVEDFDRISVENDYYLWHFVRKSQEFSQPTIRSIFDFKEGEYLGQNRMITILEIFDIPYFESYMEDSVDFLDMLGVPVERYRLKRTNSFNPIILTFNRRRLVNGTYNGFCFCPEGITNLLLDLNPEIVLNANLD